MKQLIHAEGSKHVRFCNQNENIVATIGSPGHTLNVTNLKTKFPINVSKLKVRLYLLVVKIKINTKNVFFRYLYFDFFP